MKKSLMEQQLDSFSCEARLQALGKIVKSKPAFPKTRELVNMHFHSFFSYNSEGWTPSRIALESRKSGLFAAGVIEFDVIDGLQEFQVAGEILKLRISVGVESRRYFARFAAVDIDSPGEPGVNYVIAAGFSKPLREGSAQSVKLAYFRKRAADRNIALVGRINSKVSSIAVDYVKDVLPLTPSGNATERHIITAYIDKAEKVCTDKKELVKFWSEILGKPDAEISDLINKRPALEEVVRSKFAKKGGFGYVQPTQESFPPVSEFYRWAKECGTIPMEAWLDGTSGGECNTSEYLEATIAEGAQALNIIPDRNWNIKDPTAKALKVRKLREVVETADRMGMPIIIGTEMNKGGQPVFDDLTVPELCDFKDVFVKGAKIVVGHSTIARFADYTYSGTDAESDFGKDVCGKNNFFASVGALPPLDVKKSAKLKSMGQQKAFSEIVESARKSAWTV